jgi:polyisoprenyl-phosphate glycosyltransferase
MTLVVLMPVYDDWKVAGVLLPLLGEALAAAGHNAFLVIIDDGSYERGTDLALPPAGFAGGTIVRLRRNLGHQRAICIGLAWIHSNLPGSTTVVMDADGEDDPADVPRLIAVFSAAGGDKVVFAARRRRSESMTFQAGYFAYRLLHRLLVGIPVRVGNFSVLPWSALRRLVVAEELWNHYAAAVVRGRLPRLEVSTHRARRLGGDSTMRFVPLVMHGLSAIAVFADIVCVRLLLAGAIAAPIALAVTVVSLHELASRSSAVAVAGVVGGVMVFLVAGFGGMLAVGALADRRGRGFFPESDALGFVDSSETIELS